MLERLAALGILVVALPALCGAQSLPSMTYADGQAVLTIPYFEKGAGASKVARGAILRSDDGRTFLLDEATVTPEPAMTATVDCPTVAVLNGGYRFVVPRFGWNDGDTIRFYAAALTSVDFRSFTLDPETIAETTPPGTLNGPTLVLVSPVPSLGEGKAGERIVGTRAIASSSRLSVTWRAPSGYLVDHYEITARESVYGTGVTVRAAAADTEATLTGLKAATDVSVAVAACANSDCTESGVSTPVLATTSEEYWQLQGSGGSVAGLTRIVSDGNARISATRFGPEATGPTASRIQLYYGPSPGGGVNNQMLATAVTALPVNAAVPGSYLSFTSMAGATGLLSPSTSATLVTQLATGQGVPLSAGLGARVRLFFEANGGDGRTRVMYLDSRDGYTGRDFNSGSSAICSTAADYQSGGCVPTVAIGVEGDAVSGNTKIRNARQFKLGYPTLGDWRWNGEAGTFMVFTTDQIAGCSTSNRNHGYAVWNGDAWKVQYDAIGCPKLLSSVQAAFPMHLGESRYKIYYGDPSITTGRGTSTLPFLGPKKLIYADGRSGDLPTVVDFEDWESTASGRNVVFLWPNGDQLNDAAEGFIDDFHFLAPTGSLDLQVMYLAITDGTIPPIGAAAVLINP